MKHFAIYILLLISVVSYGQTVETTSIGELPAKDTIYGTDMIFVEDDSAYSYHATLSDILSWMGDSITSAIPFTATTTNYTSSSGSEGVAFVDLNIWNDTLFLGSATTRSGDQIYVARTDYTNSVVINGTPGIYYKSTGYTYLLLSKTMTGAVLQSDGNAWYMIGIFYDPYYRTGLAAFPDSASVGTYTPKEKLTVNGAVNIGNTSATNAGSIRFTGAAFQGHDGSVWKDMSNSFTTVGNDIENNNAGDVTLNGDVYAPDLTAIPGTKHSEIVGYGAGGRLFPKNLADIVSYSGYQYHLPGFKSYNNLVYRKGDTLWIASKYNDNYDIIIRWNNETFNQTMNFDKVGLAWNTDENPSENITRALDTTIIDVSSDMIGPMVSSTSYSFFGGGHAIEGDTAHLAVNFSSDPIMVVSDGSKFVATGGTAALQTVPTTRFTYTHVSNDTLYGVTLTGNYTTADVFQRFDTSVVTRSYEFYADGIVVGDGDTVWVNKAEITVNNAIFNPDSMAVGVRDTLIYEDIYYDVSMGNIDVNLFHDYQRNVTMYVYYGMQSLALQNLQTNKIYYAHGQAEEIETAYPSSSGTWNSYPHVEKAILSTANKGICQAMWMDTTKSYAATRSSHIDGVDSAIFNPNYKTYWNLINKSVPITAGTIYEWRGTYTYFDNSDITNDSLLFAYTFISNDTLYLAIDMEGAGSYTKPFDRSILELNKKDATISHSTLYETQTDVTVTATNYGNIYFNYGEIADEEKKIWETTSLGIKYPGGIVEVDEDLQVDKNINLPLTTTANLGVIEKGGTRFLFDFKPSTNTGQNTFLGVGAGNFTMISASLSESSYNTGVGFATQDANTTGAKNTSVGWNTLGANTTGTNQVAIGYEALQSNISGTRNVAVGSASLRSNTGDDNIGIGWGAGYSSGASSGNVYIGTRAGFTTSTGSNNTSVGFYSLYTNATGASNTALGMYSGYLSTGTNNVYLGYRAGWKETGNYKVYIGADSNSVANAMGSASKLLMYGDMSNAAKSNHFLNIYAKVAIGAYKTPTVSLDVTGSADISGYLKTGQGGIADNDATPDVSGYSNFIYTGSANAVTLTDLDNPVAGLYYVILGNSDTYTVTIADSGNFKLNNALGSAVLGVDDVITLFCKADNYYIEVSRSNN